MPDICMCSTVSCPSRQDCYRHVAKPSIYQAWADFSREPKGDLGACVYYIPVTPNQPEAA